MTIKTSIELTDDCIVYQDNKKLLIDLQATKKKAENLYHELLWFDEIKKANTVKFFLTGINLTINEGRDVEPAF